jgi:7-keto-8-aminopelargonate synthetase-like enzyme
VTKVMMDTVKPCGIGAGSTRNVSGNDCHHKLLETRLSIYTTRRTPCYAQAATSRTGRHCRNLVRACPMR